MLPAPDVHVASTVALVGARGACTRAFAELTGMTARVVLGVRTGVAGDVAVWDAGSVPEPLARVYLAECNGLLVVGENVDGELLGQLPRVGRLAILRGAPPEGPSPRRKQGTRGLRDTEQVQLAPARQEVREFASGDWDQDLADAMAWVSQPGSRSRGEPNRQLSSVEKRFLEWVEGDRYSDDDFLTAVDDGTVQPWDHRAHLRVAWLANLCGDPHAGMAIACDRIRRAVEAGAGRQGAQFHATMTYFWVRMVQAAVWASQGATADFKTFLLLHPCLFHGGLWRGYYSGARMGSPAAAACVVAPDLAQLPQGTRRIVECGDAEGTLVKKGRRRCTRGAALRG
jgi:hypothetical protein